MTPPVLIAAMIWVESRGIDTACGAHGEVGCLQISPGVVDDCNRFQDLLRFTPDDRLDRARSITMAGIYLAHYATASRLGHPPTDQDRARIWSGGPMGWAIPATVAYWKKIQAALTRDLSLSTPASPVGAGFNFSSSSRLRQ